MIIALAALLAFAPPAAPTTPTAPGQSPAQQTPYSGHGAETVSPELMAKFRAAPLPSEVTRRVQAMLDVRAPSGGLLTPDGKRMFFTWGVTGVRQVWRIDGPMSFPIQMTGGEDPTSIVDITVDGKTLVLTRDRKGEENPGIYLQHVNGGSLEMVQHKPKIQTQPQLVTDDGRYLYFRSNDRKPDAYAIYRYEFATKKIEPVFEQDGLWALAGRRDDAQTLLIVKEVGSNQTEIFEYDEKTKALTPLFGQGEKEDYVVEYGRGDDVLVLTPKLGEFRRLYRFDRKNKSFVPVSPELKWDVESFSVDRAKTRIFAQVNEGGRSKPRVFDARSYKEIALPPLPEGDHVFIGPAGRVANKAIVVIDPGTAPAKSGVLDLNRKTLISWHVPSAPEVNLDAFVKVTVEEYPARDGTKIPMLVRRPAKCEKEATPCPVIVDFHGGPEAQARAGFNPRAQLFVDAGFVFVQPNVRGSDGYGKTWIHADDAAKRKDIITDIEDVAKFIRTNWAKGGKAPKIGVSGGSYGGYSTLIAMTYFAGAYDAGVDIVGISNLVTFLENTAPYRRALRVSEYGDPEKDRAVLLDLSPTTHVEKTKGPLLIVQGATDPRVPVGEAVQIYDAMQKKKLAAELIIFPDEGHGVQKRENQVAYLGHALAFFEKHLK
jgi:dipeptidyl aminopeptidase/acylaminoacyl peptidase